MALGQGSSPKIRNCTTTEIPPAPERVPEFDSLLGHLSRVADEIGNDLNRLEEVLMRVGGPRPKEETVNEMLQTNPDTYVYRFRELVTRYEGLETELRNLIGDLAEAL